MMEPGHIRLHRLEAVMQARDDDDVVLLLPLCALSAVKAPWRRTTRWDVDLFDDPTAEIPR
jgi:hypothetical protein